MIKITPPNTIQDDPKNLNLFKPNLSEPKWREQLVFRGVTFHY